MKCFKKTLVPVTNIQSNDGAVYNIQSHKKCISKSGTEEIFKLIGC